MNQCPSLDKAGIDFLFAGRKEEVENTAQDTTELCLCRQKTDLTVSLFLRSVLCLKQKPTHMNPLFYLSLSILIKGEFIFSPFVPSKLVCV